MRRRGRESLRFVGLDEKSFRRGQDYISVLCDIEGSRVLEVAAGNDTASAADLLGSLPEAQRQQLEAVVIDMNAGYEAGLQQSVPQAMVVYDRFHVAQMLGQAVDRVRRQESRQLLARGDRRLRPGVHHGGSASDLDTGEIVLSWGEVVESFHDHVRFPSGEDLDARRQLHPHGAFRLGPGRPLPALRPPARSCSGS